MSSAQLHSLSDKMMITPEIKRMISHDLEYGELPPDAEDCTVFIEVEIGPKGEEGADIFSFEAVTPKYLMRKPETRWGRGYLIVDRFSWTTVESSVKELLSHCSRQSWVEVATEIGKELHWEFENYQEYRPKP